MHLHDPVTLLFFLMRYLLFNFTIQNGYTGLMRASGGDSIDTVRVLLEAKADPNIITQVTLHCMHIQPLFVLL